MNQSPPPLPAVKKKGKGCLFLFVVAIAAFGALFIVGIMLNLASEKEWNANRESLLLKIETAINEENPEEALELARPFPSVDDPALKGLRERANTLKAAQRAERERIAAEEKVKRAEEIAANNAKKAERFADAKAQEVARLAAIEAAKTPNQRLEERLHQDLGNAEGLFGSGEKKWGSLSKVASYEESGVADIEYMASVGSSKPVEFITISKVLDSVFKVPKVNHVKIQVMADYNDTYGKTQALPWMKIRLDRVEYEKADMNNLRDNFKVEKFLRTKGDVIFRNGDDS